MSDQSHEHDTRSNLQTYLLNGGEVELTPEQAEAVGAQKIGHSGDLGLEAPAEGARPIDASTALHADDMPQSPVFDEQGKKLARDVQRAHSTENLSWHQKKGIRIAGAVLAVGAIGGTAAAVSGGEPNSVSDVNNTEPVKDALAVNGNQNPELANPEYDKRFGIRELNTDGTIDAAKLFEQVGIVEVPIANNDIEPLTDTEAESTEYGRKLLRESLQSYLPNFEAIANLYNMNNAEVRMTRASSEDLSEEQQLLLANNDIQTLLPTALSDFASASSLPLASAEIIQAVGSTAPGDASLRAVACPFSGEVPTICAQAQDEDPNFAQSSSAYDTEGDEIQISYGDLSDGTENRTIQKDIRVGIVWVDAQGNKVSTSQARFTTELGVYGGSGDDTNNQLALK